jgi:hypothetical protein
MPFELDNLLCDIKNMKAQLIQCSIKKLRRGRTLALPLFATPSVTLRVRGKLVIEFY